MKERTEGFEIEWQKIFENCEKTTGKNFGTE